LIRYLVGGSIGTAAGGLAGAILLPFMVFKFAMESIAIMMAGSGLLAPLLLVLLGALLGAVTGLGFGITAVLLVGALSSRKATPE
jgi:hypothetical protein